ncbi:MAG: O-antigen ligase family protein [Bacteroidales bacterium]|nr:O-antigen ligase family protein [Bacteroidales bacterium]
MIVLLTLIIIQLISKVVQKRKFGISLNLIEIFVFSLYGWIFFTSIIKGISIGETFRQIIVLIPFGLLLILIRRISYHYDEYYLKRLLIKGIFIVGIYQSVFGVLQYFFDKDNLGIYKTLVTGSIIYPNSYGIFMVISLSCLIVLLRETTNLKYKIFLWSACILFLFVIFINLSRGAILSGAISACIIYYVWLQKKSKKKLSKIGQWGIVVFLFTIFSCLFLFFYHLNEDSSRGRMFIMKIIYPMFNEHLFIGIGYNQFKYSFLNYQELFFQNENNLIWAHKAIDNGSVNNQFLKCFLELGLVGGCIFSILWLIIIRCTYVHYNFKYGYWFFFVILTLFFHCFLDETFQSLVIIFIFLYVIALIPNKLFVFRVNSLKWPVVLLISLLGMSLVQNILKMYLSSFSYKYECLAANALSNAQYDLAFYNCNEALSIDSTSLTCKTILGRTLIGKSTLEQTLMKNKYLQEGIKYLENVKCQYHDRDLYLALSYGYLKTNDYQNALYYAQKVHKMFPVQARPKLLLGILYYGQNNKAQSKVYLEDCVKACERNNRKNSLQINMMANSLLRKLNDSVPLPLLMDDLKFALSIDSIMIAH